MEATATLAVVIFRDENFSELRHKAACIQLGFGMVFRNGTTSIWSHLPLKVGRRSGVVTRVLRGESANVSQERLCSLRRRFYYNNNNNNNSNKGFRTKSRGVLIPSLCCSAQVAIGKLLFLTSSQFVHSQNSPGAQIIFAKTCSDHHRKTRKNQGLF